MNIVAIIQARVGSTRLPNKVLLKLEGKTVLERVIERIKASKLVDEVVVTTTQKQEDNQIEKICSEIDVKIYRGSEDDVLDRYYQAAKMVNAVHVVRITADCPLIDPKIIDDVIDFHLKEKSDYTSNTINPTYPDGEDVEVFTLNALRTAWEEAKLMSEREHVTPYFRNHPDKFKIFSVENEINLSDKRWTLDNEEDYVFIKQIYGKLYAENPLFGMGEILDFLDKNKELEKINSHITRNKGYIKSLKEDKKL